MIISVSRRTDVPAFYSRWFFNRLKEGYVLVRNPMNPKRISRINLSPDVVDGFVFWTKNPAPMLKEIHKLKDYAYYFQVTITSYGKDIEENVPSKNDVVIPSFIELSKLIGSDRMIWRYDPIILTEKYNVDYHVEYFEKMAKKLQGCTKKGVISFLDFYKNTEKNLRNLKLLPISEKEMKLIGEAFSVIAPKYGIELASCCESIDLTEFGIKHNSCIDGELFEKILGQKLNFKPDKNQRKGCGCIESIDIGAYNSCKNGCKYCYANYNPKLIDINFDSHDENAPILLGEIKSDDLITERKLTSFKDNQIELT